MTETRVAVYGTLRRSYWNHHWMAGTRFLGVDRLRAITLYDLGPYPGALEEPSNGVEVEVYAVDDDQLRRIDILEDHMPQEPAAGLYDRKVLPTRHGPAWVYLYNHSVAGCRAIREGAWVPAGKAGLPE